MAITVYEWLREGSREIQDPTGNIASMLANAQAALSTLEAATASKPTWDGLTAQQRQDADRIAIRVVCRLTRLVLGQLDVAA